MNFVQEVQKETVLNKALALVRGAEKEILVTMDVDDEVRAPLPTQYHTLLETKARRGVKITRYGFGSKRGFHALQHEGSFVHFLYAGSIRRYQRMLVIDNKRGLFKIADIVCYTEFTPLITALVDYISMVYNKEEL